MQKEFSQVQSFLDQGGAGGDASLTALTVMKEFSLGYNELLKLPIPAYMSMVDYLKREQEAQRKESDKIKRKK